jgi:hypothetical protein
MRCGVLLLGLAVLVGCAKKDPRYCDSETPCTLLEYPYCDEDGAISGIRNNCIPSPGGGADAAVADASIDGGSLMDAAPVGPGIGMPCDISGASGISCPEATDCMVLAGETMGVCAPRCDEGASNSDCQAAYEGVNETRCEDPLGTGEARCFVHCAPGDNCGAGMVCRTDTSFGLGVCIGLENGLGQSCTASEDCPPANDCIDHDGEGDVATASMCGPSCPTGSTDICGYNSDLVPAAFPADCWSGTCVLVCGSADECPQGLVCSGGACVVDNCATTGQVACGGSCFEPGSVDCTTNADCTGGTVCRDCSCVAP